MELLDVLDDEGKYTGRTAERKIVHEQGLWHIHVGLWIMNREGKLLFQKRSESKLVNPNKWTRTGGHVDAKEEPIVAMQREVEEEIGVKIPIDEMQLMNIRKDEIFPKNQNMIHRHFTYSYFAIVDYKIEDYKMQKEEVSDLKYISIEEMKEAKKNNDDSYTFVKWKNFDEVINMLEDKRKNLLNI